MNDKEYAKWLEGVKKRTRQRREQQEKEDRRRAKLEMSHGLCCLSIINLIIGKLI